TTICRNRRSTWSARSTKPPNARRSCKGIQEMATIHVDIVSAERSIYSGQANMVFAPAEMGEIGIAPRHSPLITRLASGEIRVQTEGGEELMFFVSGGVLEVQPSMVT